MATRAGAALEPSCSAFRAREASCRAAPACCAGRQAHHAARRRVAAVALTAARRRTVRVLRRGAAQASAQPPWQEVADPASGRAYWWNTATGETRWEPPTATATVAAAAAEAPHASGAATAAADVGNDALLQLFMRYLLSPEAMFDYPSPSAAFLELVEAHRYAIYERTPEQPFYLHLSDEIDACDGSEPLSGEWLAAAATAAATAAAAAAAADEAQSDAVRDIAIMDRRQLNWNTSNAPLTRRQALESLRARLANPVVRDANPAV